MTDWFEERALDFLGVDADSAVRLDQLMKIKQTLREAYQRGKEDGRKEEREPPPFLDMSEDGLVEVQLEGYTVTIRARAEKDASASPTEEAT